MVIDWLFLATLLYGHNDICCRPSPRLFNEVNTAIVHGSLSENPPPRGLISSFFLRTLEFEELLFVVVVRFKFPQGNDPQ